MSDSFNDKLVSLAVAMECLKRDMDGINDYGEVTGFCDEQDRIFNDAFSVIGTYTARAYTLRRRVALWREQNQTEGDRS